MIKIRPLIQVLGKIIRLPKGSYIDPESLGSGVPDGTNFLRGDGTWATAGGGGAGSIPHGTATGTDTYAVTISGIASLNDGDAFLVRFTNGNTTGCTLNINLLGAKTLYRNNDGPLIGGDILDGAEMLCIYNSSLDTFQAIGTSPNTLLAYVTNADSVTITKGQPVYAFGGTGDRLRVKLANNTGDATSAQTVGLVLSTSIASNQKGFIVVSGLLDGLSILPTSTWSDGDAVYLGATAGSITNVKPSAPNHLVYLGFVTTASNGSAGRLYVRVQNGYELQELHNVSIPTTPTDGQVLTYELSTSLWKAKTPSGGGLTVGTTAVTSGTIGRVFFQGTGDVVQQDAGFFFDSTNKRLGVGTSDTTSPNLGTAYVNLKAYRATGNSSLTLGVGSNTWDVGNIGGNGLWGMYNNNVRFVVTNAGLFGIGTTAPAARLDVRAQGALSTDIAFRVRNSANTANILTVNGVGQIWSNGKGFIASNTGFGEFSLNALTTGTNIAAFGNYALQLNTTGANNTAFGKNAGFSTTYGINNTYLGYNAGAFDTGDGHNTIIGASAGSTIAFSVGYNTIIGASSTSGITTGGGNTLIGARITGLSNPSNNVILADGQGNQVIRKDANHNQILGTETALATTATNGFTYIPTCAGTPTGTPTAITGKVPIVADTTNNKLYVYLGGAWVAMN